MRFFSLGFQKLFKFTRRQLVAPFLGRRQPAIASPGDQSSCELQQFLEAQRKKYYRKTAPAKIAVRKNATIL